MTGLLEFKEKLRLFYSKNEVFLLPVLKFLLTFLVLNTINSHMGYMTQLDNISVVLIVALLCSFLPTGTMVFFSTIFTLMHMYELSMEVAILGLCIYALMYLLFLRLGGKESLFLILTPLFCLWNIPHIMPIAAGLVGTPATGITLGCGIIIYYLLATIVDNASTISTMGEEEAIAKIQLIIDALLENKTMLIMICVFAITVMIVYFIRRLSVDYAWTIAIITGVIINLMLLLLGDLFYDTNMSVTNAIIGTLLAVVAGKILQFFKFCVDYSRTEKVQFEDDEYYYYVKAIPKMTVAAPTKTVKKINSQRHETAVEQKTSLNKENTRSVTTERTTSNNYGQRSSFYNTHLSNGKSMTINSNVASSEEEEDYDDYEELF